MDTLCYLDLGVGVRRAEDGSFLEYMVVFRDEEYEEFQPYQGKLSWNQKQLKVSELTLDLLPTVFGEWYWIDRDEYSTIAFYEYHGKR